MIEYAMYKGEELLYIGTVDEIAEWHGCSRDTIFYYKTPSYKKRVKNRKNPRNYITITRLDDDDDE